MIQPFKPHRLLPIYACAIATCGLRFVVFGKCDTHEDCKCPRCGTLGSKITDDYGEVPWPPPEGAEGSTTIRVDGELVAYYCVPAEYQAALRHWRLYGTGPRPVRGYTLADDEGTGRIQDIENCEAPPLLDDEVGLAVAPSRYNSNEDGRETLDRQLDAMAKWFEEAIKLAKPEHPPTLDEKRRTLGYALCKAQALKYRDRINAATLACGRGEPLDQKRYGSDIDKEKFYEAMALCLVGQGPDPRAGRR